MTHNFINAPMCILLVSKFTSFKNVFRDIYKIEKKTHANYLNPQIIL